MKVIYRTSVISRKLLERSSLFRITRLPSGKVEIDETYQKGGRGAYLEKDKDFILQAKKKKVLNRALKCNVSDAIYDELIEKL